MPQSQPENAKELEDFEDARVPAKLSAEQRLAVSRIVRDPRSAHERVIDKVIDRLINALDERRPSNSQPPE